MRVCSGGIIGMGETEDDRLRMLEVLSNFDPSTRERSHQLPHGHARHPAR